jgi:hydrogenase maturation protein HypF
VQGVGFRPFVYRLALEQGLAGYVLNDEQGVLLEVEGDVRAVECFLARLERDAPPLAAIEAVVAEPVATTGETGFAIVESATSGIPDAPVTPDAATCEHCLAELLDPADRRYRYPFVNCTNCGPRFTIVRGVPYDRPLTTMAGFRMCAECRREYDDPADRRFHAQPNACPRCGPRAWLTDASGSEIAVPGTQDAVAGAARRLAEGCIVAIKGVGGFHLACEARDETVVAELRARKHREDKPFALMVADVDAAQALVELTAEEERLLRSPERPIVLARRRSRAAVAAAVAPASGELGVMLPYSPLHHLLLRDVAESASPVAALVMTSGNVSDEPIAHEDDDALARLAGIADAFLLHDRPIHARTDDSVVRAGRTGPRRRPLMLRRSRGYVPRPLALPVPARLPLLACGAELKSTFCVAKGSRAWVSHHIGDLEHYAAYASFREGIARFEQLFAVRPSVVAHDLHPDYLSTAYALERDGVETVGVQHHHAHLAACLAEHGCDPARRAVGAIYDGTGYGPDGTIWGGELLVGGLLGYERAGGLWPVRMPGGAAAIREPWRMACAWLAEAYGEPQPLPRTLHGAVDPEAWRAVGQIAATAAIAPVTTSMGRLFDAVAALCGVRPTVTYEGQAAVELEAGSSPHYRGAYELPLADVDGAVVLDARVTVRAVDADLRAGEPVAAVAARFHATIADATTRACLAIAEARGLDAVVLSGGVFQNRRLLEGVAMALHLSGLQVLVPEQLPVNDGGIAFGQAAIAAAA